MSKTNKEELAKKRQSKLIKHLRKEENVMKWGLIAAGIIILLLLLYIGYATDWTTGLKTDSADQPNSTSLGVAKTAQNGTADTPSTNQGSSSTNSTTNTGGTGTDTSKTGTNSTNNTTTEKTTTSNTTTNNTDDTPTSSSSPLLDLYTGTKIGDTLDSIISSATANNIGVDCQDLLLIRTCTLTDGDTKVQVRGLLSNGIVTSVLNLP